MPNVRIERNGRSMSAYLSGELDHHTAAFIRSNIDSELELNSVNDLLLDFKDVAFMDSSGVGLIMGRYKRMQACRGKLRIANLSGEAARIVEMSGITKLLNIAEE